MASGTRLKVLVSLVLAGLLAVLVGALVVADPGAGPTDGPPEPAPPASNAAPQQAAPTTGSSSGPSTGGAAALLAFAEEAVEAVLSYDPRTFDDDLVEAVTWTTRDFGADLVETLQGVRSGVEDVGGVVTSEVLASGLVERRGGTATALLFVDQTSTTEDDPEPRVLAARLLVRLARVEGGWAVDGIDSEGTAGIPGGDADRRQVLTVARDFVEVFTSVDPDPERHLRALRPFLAPGYLDEIRTQLRYADERRRSRGRVIAAGVAELGATSSTVLVAADARRPRGQTQSYRLLVDLVRDSSDDEWKVAGLRLV